MNINHKRFAEEYVKSGNGTQSYLKVYGNDMTYESAAANSTRLLKIDSVQQYIKELNDKISEEAIADMIEVQRFWTGLMRSASAEDRDRIKTSELIARTHGAFIDRLEQTGDINIKVEWFDDEEEED